MIRNLIFEEDFPENFHLKVEDRDLPNIQLVKSFKDPP